MRTLQTSSSNQMRRTKRAALCAAIATSVVILAGTEARSQTTFLPTQVANLFAPDGTAGDEFGISVAINGDTSIAGALRSDDNGVDSGSAYIFVRDAAGIWSQQARLLANDGASNDFFGTAVAVFGDTAVVGAPFDDDNGVDSGSVYVFVRNASGIWTQQTKLLALDGAASDEFGDSVAISADAILVGARLDSDNGPNSGSAYVFVLDQNGVWAQQAKLLPLDGAAGDGFGGSVSVTRTTAIIGAKGDDAVGIDSGSAYIFKGDSAGLWTQQAKLLPADGTVNDSFGAVVSIDSNQAVVGAPFDDDNGSNSGSAYVFLQDVAGAWIQQAKLLATDGATDDEFGASVSIGDGTVVVGARLDDDGGGASGSSYTFMSDLAGVWTQQSKLVASDGTPFDEFGRSVAAFNNLVIVGAWLDNDLDSGSVYIFIRNAAGQWMQQTKLLASNGAAGDEFGISVSISGDTAIAGALRDDDHGVDAGAAFVFVRDTAGNWSQQAKLFANDGATNDSFGAAVAITGDTAVVGSPLDGGGAGSVYVFSRDLAGVWTQQAKILAADGLPADFFGLSVGISGDTIIVGAHGVDINGSRSGAVYIFVQDPANGIWTQRAKLLASDGAAEDFFGFGTAISNDTVLIGAQNDDNIHGVNAGAAYIFVRNANGTWTQQAKLVALDGSQSTLFGRSVSLDGSTAVIGTPEDRDNGSSSGAAYVFVRNAGGVWAQHAKLLASDGTLSDRFGFSVAVTGARLVIGAFTADVQGLNSGSAYLFARDASGVWTQKNKMNAIGGESGDQFGTSVAVSGDMAVFGANRNDDNGPNSGSMYVFDLSPSPSPDLNGDGVVNAADLATLLTQWGSAGAADFNNDGVVNAIDLATLLTNWSP